MLKRITLCVLAGMWVSSVWVDDHVAWLAHLSANDQFKSTILVRNDHFDQAQTASIDFLGADGSAPMVSMSVDGGELITAASVTLSLAPQETQAITLFSVSGGDDRSVAARVTGADDLAVEGSFNLFVEGVKTSKVGVGADSPQKFFKINLNGGPDPFSGAAELRGMGVTNVSADQTCDCLVSLVDAAGVQKASALVSIPPHGKFVGVVSGLFPEAGELLGSGYGHVTALCSERVSVLALSFEGAIMTTVPTTQEEVP